MSPMTRLLFVAAAIGCVAPARGEDHRIRTLDYSDSAVVRLVGCPNFQTMVHFGSGEQIENVGLGDAAQWQVVPNKRADLLFVKPLVAGAFSNMTVVTDRHAYSFELRSAAPEVCKRGDVVYDLRFHYNDPPPAAPAKPTPPPDPESLLPLPEKRNAAYTYSGDKDLIPMRAFDDGKSTYMRWAEGVPAPAIYAIGRDGSESLVNCATRGDYVVVELVAPAFTLRRGEHAATLYNDAFIVPRLDALSPQPAKNQDHGLWPF